jgi:periplasmic divalent cation tolerance protein
MNTILLFYVTHENKEAANQLCQQLLDQNLIACANLIPIDSMYHWDGAVCTDGEVVSILKTDPGLEDRVEQTILALHPYSVPCILRMEAKVNAAYYDWVCNQVQKDR